MAARGDDARGGQGGAEQVAPRRHGSARDKEAAPRRAGGPTAAARGPDTPLPAARGGATGSSARGGRRGREALARAHVRVPPPRRRGGARVGAAMATAQRSLRRRGGTWGLAPGRSRALTLSGLSVAKLHLWNAAERAPAPSGMRGSQAEPRRHTVLALGSPQAAAGAPRVSHRVLRTK